MVEGLVSEQPLNHVERHGPAVQAAFDAQGNPTPAALGFAKSCGVDIKELEIDNKVGKLLCKKTVAGQKTIDLLPGIVKGAIKKLPIARLMRWGNNDTEFVRPVHSVIMMYGAAIVNAEILGKKVGNKTFGHRVHCKTKLTINHPRNYEKILYDKGYVVADFDKRKKIIQEQAIKISKRIAGDVLIDEDLLNEVTSIVELPVPLLARFPERYLQVPKECLISSMQHHQKCFPIVNAQHELLPFFITISNLQSKDEGEVIKGNERVMNARLADAEFFYNKICSFL